MINFLQGDVFDNIKKLDDSSIDCVVTSPPYWGLRDYGTASYEGGDKNCDHTICDSGIDLKKNENIKRPAQNFNKSFCIKCGAKRIDKQLGLEPTYQEHIQNIVELFRAMKPKLKDSATIWLNYGDSYAATINGTKAKDIKNDDRGFVDKPFSTIQGSIKPKDLVMIPNRIAIALQDDGWWIRSEIIWHKPNPMPESTKDRPTQCHEKIWLITKSKKYYYDAEAVREPCQDETIRRMTLGNKGKVGNNKNSTGWKQLNNYWGSEQSVKDANKGRNRRNVWTITTKPCKEAHFATFPKDLIEPCIKAGCPEKVCTKCGKPQIKELYREKKWQHKKSQRHTDKTNPKGSKNAFGQKYQKWANENPLLSKTISNCECNADFVPGVVFDPFGGAGTTAIVAKLLNRKSIMSELNPEYIKIAKARINKEFGMFE